MDVELDLDCTQLVQAPLVSLHLVRASSGARMVGIADTIVLSKLAKLTLAGCHG